MTWLFVSSTAAFPTLGASVVIPMTEAECPTCVFGNWSCPRRTCTEAGPRALESFDFTYVTAGCWAVIPATTHSIIMDLNTACAGADPSLTCDTMQNFGFDGLSILRGCDATSGAAADLVQERCGWACKHGRPTARCEWAFNPHRRLEPLRGPLQACWFLTTCTGAHEEVRVGCIPIPPWRPAGEATRPEVEQVEQALLEANAAHNATTDNLTAMRQELEETRATLEELVDEHNATADQLTAARAHHQAAEQRLSEATAAHYASLEELRWARSSHSVAAHELLKTRLVHGATLQVYRSENEEQRRTIAWLSVAAGGLGGLAAVLLICVGLFLCARKRSKSVKPAYCETNLVVVGRPIQDRADAKVCEKSEGAWAGEKKLWRP